MRCLVYVKFLPGGSIAPVEFFARINAQWSHVENPPEQVPTDESPSLLKSGICIADFDSIEQLTEDLAIMPGAGISSVEVVPISEGFQFEQLSTTPMQVNETNK